MLNNCPICHSPNIGSPKLGSSLKNIAGRLVNPIEFPELFVDSAKALGYPFLSLLSGENSTFGVCYECYNCGVFLIHCENCGTLTRTKNYKSYSSKKCGGCGKTVVIGVNRE